MDKNYRAELTGVLGDPVDDNPTGVVEEAAFAALGLNYRYITCRVGINALEDAVKGMRALGARGFNLTMPHKIAVIPYLDDLTEAARLIGAVNTVFVKDGRYIGENTDGKGFVRALRDAGITLAGKTVTMLGAGGAARAICMECALAGAKAFNIINRDAGRGTTLAEAIHLRTKASAAYLPWQGTAPIPQDTDILVNGTCVGLRPHQDDMPAIIYADIHSGMTVCDVVFNPAQTAFLTEAALRGACTVNGLGMLAGQAALNYTLWTGVDAPFDIMKAALKRELE
jgi:shikimate dehydrogenase